MRQTILIFVLTALLGSSCGSSKKATTGKQDPQEAASGSAATFSKAQAALLDNNTYQLEVVSEDETYGYTQNNPICVGGVKGNEGPLNERRFLNALLGPDGQKVEYTRRGSCCPFNTRNAMIGNQGLLDAYIVKYEGLETPAIIYINMYDFGKLKAPKGFTIKK